MYLQPVKGLLPSPDCFFVFFANRFKMFPLLFVKCKVLREQVNQLKLQNQPGNDDSVKRSDHQKERTGSNNVCMRHCIHCTCTRNYKY